MRTGPALREHWAGGPRTYLGIQAAGFPNFFFFIIIGGPQSTTGNIPRYTEVQANWVADCIASMRDQGFTRVETTAEGEEYWSDPAYSTIKGTLQETTSTSSWAWGTNVPGGRGGKAVWLAGGGSGMLSLMSFLSSMSTEAAVGQPIRAQFEVFLDEHRGELNRCLDGLTEEQARRSLVPSRTTLLGLVKHATFVEKAWFDEGVTGRPRAEIGIPATPDESFILGDGDTIATVRQAHREACEASRRATASLGLDDVLRGNRRGPLPLRWVYLHVLRELAQHCGHADILREQLMSQ